MDISVSEKNSRCLARLKAGSRDKPSLFGPGQARPLVMPSKEPIYYLTLKSLSYIRVVHSRHFSAIFGSFSHVWQKNCQNDVKNEMKNDVKNGYCEHPGKQK